MQRVRDRKEIKFFGAVWRASPGYAAAWWSLLVLRGVLPAMVSLGFGWLVSSVTRGTSLAGPLVLFGAGFTVSIVLHPIHQMVSMNLGTAVSSHLYRRLMIAGVSPDGIGHLERADLANDLTMARDFDQGMTGPPLSISMDFITGGLLDLVIGTVSSLLLFALAWWAPFLVLGAWFSTHWLLRESGVWADRNTSEVQTAQRHAEYAYRLAVDAGPAKELRYFGLAGWVTDRFIATRRKLADMQFEATRLREKSVATCVAIVVAANGFLFWYVAQQTSDGRLSTAKMVVFVQAAIGASSIAFGGLNWALDGASAPVLALHRLERAMAEAGALANPTSPVPAAVKTPEGAPEIRFRDVTFAYESDSGRNVLRAFDLTIPAGTSMAIVGKNGAGKTTIAKLICRLYDPTAGSIEVDGVPLTNADLDQWRHRLTAVFQDFIRFELPLRTNVAPKGAPEEAILGALADAGGAELAGGNLDTILSKAYPDGTDLSGGQWQRVALARALCAVRLGADVVLLDEPTAQLDVRGESEIFERVVNATRGCTTILISHRFSTVRLADRICVVDNGAVVEVGSHDDLIERGGHYKTMFNLQASRFAEDGNDGTADETEVTYETL